MAYEPWWVDLAVAAQGWATVVAVLVGGVWALYTYRLKRQAETALDLQVSVQLHAYGARVLAFVGVQLGNRGLVRVDATRSKPAYQDDDEIVPYAGHIRLRPLDPKQTTASALQWFDGSTDGSNDLNDSFLSSYETDGTLLFWLEPGECYRLGSTLVLDPALYMGMVTFVGNGPKEFWRQTFVIDARAVERRTSADACASRIAPPGVSIMPSVNLTKPAEHDAESR